MILLLTFLFALTQIEVNFASEKKLLCIFNQDDMTLECKVDANINCKDPSNEEIEKLFAKKEFELIDLMHLSKGSNDLLDELKKYPMFAEDYQYDREIISRNEITNCQYNDYLTDNKRSICPWNEIVYRRHNLYPHFRKYAECIQDLKCNQYCSEIQSKIVANRKKQHACEEHNSIELVLYRSICDGGQFIWEAGFEKVSNLCTCLESYL